MTGPEAPRPEEGRGNAIEIGLTGDDADEKPEDLHLVPFSAHSPTIFSAGPAAPHHTKGVETVVGFMLV